MAKNEYDDGSEVKVDEPRKLNWDPKRDFYKEYDKHYMPWLSASNHAASRKATPEYLEKLFKNGLPDD